MPGKQLIAVLLVTSAIAWALSTSLAVDYAARNSFLLWVEHWTGDWRTAFFSDRLESQHPGVVVVAVTDDTLAAFPYRSPVDRAYLARLVTALDAMEPRAIGIDFLFIRPTEPAKDQTLANVLSRARTRVVSAVADERSELSEAEAAYQNEFLLRSGVRPGYANLLTGGDRIVRYLAARVENSRVPLSFAQALAAPRLPPLSEPRRIAWLLKPNDNSDTFLTIPAHLLVASAGTSVSPAAALFAPRIKDRIVIIGAVLPDIDRHMTPLPDWEGDEQAGVLLQAQAVAQILDGRDIRRLSKKLLMTLYAVLALFGVMFGLRHGRLASTFYSGAAALAVAALDIALFASSRQFLPYGACILALVLGMIGGLILRRMLRPG